MHIIQTNFTRHGSRSCYCGCLPSQKRSSQEHAAKANNIKLNKNSTSSELLCNDRHDLNSMIMP